MIDRVRRAWAAWRGDAVAAAAARGDARDLRVGRVVDATRWLADALRGEISPASIRSAYIAGDAGDWAALTRLYDAICERDDLIRGECELRCAAVTSLPWEIVAAIEPTQSGESDAAMQRSVDYCRAALRDVNGLAVSLAHLAEAVARGAAAAQVVWRRRGRRHEIELIEPVAHEQLRGDAGDVRRLRITGDGDWRGVAIDEWRGNLIAHQPRRIGGLASRGGLLRTAAYLYLLRVVTRRGLAVAVEQFGVPLRIAKYPRGASQDVIDAMLRMLRDMGTDAAGVFEEGASLEMVERKVGGERVFEVAAQFAADAITRLFRGATLTAQMSASGGSYAAARVHEQIRADLLQHDMEREAETLREQLLAPLVAIEFGADAPVPYWRRVIEQPRDVAADAQVLALAVNELGLAVPAGWAAERLGVTLAAGVDPDTALPGRPLPAATPGMYGLDGLAASRPRGNVCRACAAGGRHDAVACALVDRTARRGGGLAALMGWLVQMRPEASGHSQAVIAAAVAALHGVADATGAAEALADVLAAADRDGLTERMGELLLAAELAGREVMRQRIGARRVAASGQRDIVRIAAAETGFARLPFVEAIDALRRRLGVTPAQFDAMDRAARSRAFRVAAVWGMRLLSELHAELAAALEAGETVRDFRRRALALEGAGADEPSFGARRGWTGENPWHADLVAWQNTAMAYTAGQYRQAVEAGVPAWRFVSHGESCVICEPEVGRTYAMADTDRMPPLHFGCDCDQEPVFEDELGGYELNDSDRDGNPALEIERARPGGYVWSVRDYGGGEPIDLAGMPAGLSERFAAWARSVGLEVRA